MPYHNRSLAHGSGCLLFMLALLIFASSANAFEMVVSSDYIVVHTGEVKTIEVGAVSAADDILVFATPIEQPWMSMPTHMLVNASQQAYAQIKLMPFDRTEPKIYTFNLVLQSLRTGERRERNLTIVVRSAEVAIEKIDVTGMLEPNGWGQLDVYVKNYEETAAAALLTVDSELVKFTESLSLGPGEFRTVRRGFTIPACQRSGQYVISANLDAKGARIFSAEESFVIPEKFIPDKVKQETSSGFKTSTQITVKNNGNIAGTAEVAESIPGALFFSGDKPTSTDGVFKWVLNLDACQSRVIKYQIDYTPIPVALFLIFAIWYVFFRLRTIRVSKRILQKAKIEKGMEYTVGLNVKCWVKASDIEIHDFVPSLFEVRDTPGIKPIKRKTEAGTELVWRFKEFVPYEERILDYKIVPLFSISGHVNLPRAYVSFRHLARRVTKSSSATSLGLKEIVEKPIEQPRIAERVAKFIKKAFRRLSSIGKSGNKTPEQKPEPAKESAS